MSVRSAAVTSSRRRLDELGSHLGLVQRCAHRSAAVTAALLETLFPTQTAWVAGSDAF